MQGMPRLPPRLLHRALWLLQEAKALLPQAPRLLPHLQEMLRQMQELRLRAQATPPLALLRPLHQREMLQRMQGMPRLPPRLLHRALWPLQEAKALLPQAPRPLPHLQEMLRQMRGPHPPAQAMPPLALLRPLHQREMPRRQREMLQHQQGTLLQMQGARQQAQLQLQPTL
jgi:hypothetical protein